MDETPKQPRTRATPTPRDPRVELAQDAVCVVLVGLLGLKLSWGLWAARDIGLNDEAIYMASGVRLFQPLFPNAPNGLPYAQDGPLYSFWYRLLSLLVEDRVLLFYVNAGVLLTLIGIGAWVLMRVTGIGRLVASAAVFWLLTMRLFEQWSFTTFFSAALLLFGVSVAARRPTVRGALLALVVVFVVAGWARPENCTSALVVLGVALAATVRAVRSRSISWRLAVLELMVALSPAVPLFLIFGAPLGGGRSFYAFGQHYSWNVVRREHLHVNAWSDWLDYVHRDFGSATTIGEAMAHNPTAFLAHMGMNLREYPLALARVAEPVLGLPMWAEEALQVVSVVALLIGLLGALRHVRSACSDPRRAAVFAAFFAAFATNVASAIIIFPRVHYLVPVVALGMPIVVAGFPAWRARVDRSLVAPLVLWAFLLVVAPNPARGWTPYSVATGELPRRSDGYRVKTIERLRAIGIARPVVSLESGWGFTFFAGIPSERVAQWDKDRSFDDFVRERRIDLIVVDYDLRSDERFRGDPEFARFLDDPARLGFRAVKVDGADAFIAIREPG
jgi:hypothetical protein